MGKNIQAEGRACVKPCNRRGHRGSRTWRGGQHGQSGEVRDGGMKWDSTGRQETPAGKLMDHLGEIYDRCKSNGRSAIRGI